MLCSRTHVRSPCTGDGSPLPIAAALVAERRESNAAATKADEKAAPATVQAHYACSGGGGGRHVHCCVRAWICNARTMRAIVYRSRLGSKPQDAAALARATLAQKQHEREKSRVEALWHA